jgi:uncharacterized membrane protein YidH (DUF202 family)
MENKTQPHSPLISRKNVLVELWEQNRRVFQELLKHVLIFTLFIGSLTLLHEVLKFSSLPNDRKQTLDNIHFYMSVVALVIFSTSFMIKVIIFEFKDMKGL